ncbi:TPA: ead/Ea22-like family protein [Citrobacter freundii]
MTKSPMTALNKQALRQAAEKATAGQWVVELGDEVYAVDGDDSEQIAMMFSDNGRSDAAFIAAASPVAVLSLLDENLQLQRDKYSLEAVAVAMRDDTRDAREKLEAAEKRIAELEGRAVSIPEVRITVAESRRKNLTWRELGAYNEGADVAKGTILAAIRAAGIGVKGE